MYDIALESFHEAVYLNPSDSYFIYRLGVVYRDLLTFVSQSQTQHKMEKFDEALESYNRAIELNPTSPEYLLGLSKLAHTFSSSLARGDLFLSMKKIDEAVADFLKCSEFDPNNLLIMNNLGHSIHSPLLVSDCRIVSFRAGGLCCGFQLFQSRNQVIRRCSDSWWEFADELQNFHQVWRTDWSGFFFTIVRLFSKNLVNWIKVIV